MDTGTFMTAIVGALACLILAWRGLQRFRLGPARMMQMVLAWVAIIVLLSVVIRRFSA